MSIINVFSPASLGSGLAATEFCSDLKFVQIYWPILADICAVVMSGISDVQTGTFDRYLRVCRTNLADFASVKKVGAKFSQLSLESFFLVHFCI